MFKERIRKYYDALTPGFRKLADFIMQNTLDAAFLTASELARRVDVDPATVVRFSQEIGYSGYRELSREIKRYVRARKDTRPRVLRVIEHVYGDEQYHPAVKTGHGPPRASCSILAPFISFSCLPDVRSAGTSRYTSVMSSVISRIFPQNSFALKRSP